MDVPQTHVTELLLGLLLRRLPEGVCQHIRGHPHPVVFQFDEHITLGLIPTDGDGQLPGAALGLDAVENGVFRQGLEGELGG